MGQNIKTYSNKAKYCSSVQLGLVKLVRIKVHIPRVSSYHTYKTMSCSSSRVLSKLLIRDYTLPLALSYYHSCFNFYLFVFYLPLWDKHKRNNKTRSPTCVDSYKNSWMFRIKCLLLPICLTDICNHDWPVGQSGL